MYEKNKKINTPSLPSTIFGGVVGPRCRTVLCTDARVCRTFAVAVGIVDDEDGTRSYAPFCGRRCACFVSLCGGSVNEEAPLRTGPIPPLFSRYSSSSGLFLI